MKRRNLPPHVRQTWDSIGKPYRDLAEKHLTDKQLAVLQYRIAKCTWRQIGAELHIHEATARGHFNAALDALRPHIRKDEAA